MRRTMDKIDLDIEHKNIFGGIDRLLVNAGMIIIAFIPTYFYLIFKPKTMSYMLRGEEPDGRESLRLGPGLTFILTLLFVIAVGHLTREMLAQPPNPERTEVTRKGIRMAVSEGNLWRSVILSFPFYLAALIFGCIIHISHRLCRKNSNLTQSVGIGLYTLSTLLLLIVPLGISSDYYGSDSHKAALFTTIPIITFFIILPWQIFSFSKQAFGNSRSAAILVAVVSLVLVFLILIVFGIIAYQFQ